MNEVTRILSAIEHGDPAAAEQLLPLVYDELRKLAAGQWRTRAPATPSMPRPWSTRPTCGWWATSNSTAEGTSSPRRPRPCGGSSSSTPARGGGSSGAADRVRLELLDQARSLAEDPDLLLSLDELLARLGAEDAARRRVAHLHLFGGLSVEEAGDVLGLSRPVAYRNWKYARAWLREALEK